MLDWRRENLFYNSLLALGAWIDDGGMSKLEDDIIPDAYLNVFIFDVNYNLVDLAYKKIESSAQQVGTTKTPHNYLIREITISQPGYAYIFLSNENLKQVDVYFDDLKVTHTHSPIVAGADFYPFGLAMDGREIKDEHYRWGYQGQYAEKDTITGLNEFQLRMYDARFGRWTTTDPYGQFASPYLGMGNAPHMGVDPDGGFWGMGAIASGAIIGAGVGALAGYAVTGDWEGALIGAGAGAGLGVMAGAIYNASTYDIPGLGRIAKNPTYPVKTYSLSKKFSLFNHLNTTAELVVQDYVKKWKFKKNVKDVLFEFKSDASYFKFDVSRKGKSIASYSLTEGGDNPTSSHKNKGEFQVNTEAAFPPAQFNKPGLKPDDPGFIHSAPPMSGNVTLKVRVKLNLNQRMVWRARRWK